jgi:hypothetical protein
MITEESPHLRFLKTDLTPMTRRNNRASLVRACVCSHNARRTKKEVPNPQLPTRASHIAHRSMHRTEEQETTRRGAQERRRVAVRYAAGTVWYRTVRVPTPDSPLRFE